MLLRTEDLGLHYEKGTGNLGADNEDYISDYQVRWRQTMRGYRITINKRIKVIWGYSMRSTYICALGTWHDKNNK